MTIEDDLFGFPSPERQLTRNPPSVVGCHRKWTTDECLALWATLHGRGSFAQYTLTCFYFMQAVGRDRDGGTKKPFEVAEMCYRDRHMDGEGVPGLAEQARKKFKAPNGKLYRTGLPLSWFDRRKVLLPYYNKDHDNPKGNREKISWKDLLALMARGESDLPLVKGYTAQIALGNDDDTIHHSPIPQFDVIKRVLQRIIEGNEGPNYWWNFILMCQGVDNVGTHSSR